VVPLLVNLLTPVALALCVTTLRRSVKELMQKSDILEEPMGAVELTSIKLAISATTAFLVAFLAEGGFGWASDESEQVYNTPWWVSLRAYPADGLFTIFVGCLSILLFQVNLTWLIRLTSSVSVGMVSGAKVLPQWLINGLFGTGVHLTDAMICGATLIFLSCAVFMCARSRDVRQSCDDVK